MIALIDEDLTETLYLCIMIINFIFIKIPKIAIGYKNLLHTAEELTSGGA